MAQLLVLSVFNGLEELIGSLFRSFDLDIKITLREGKTFALDASLRQRIETTKGISKVVDILEDNALLRYRDHQIVIKLKGVSEEFLHQSRLEPFIKQGSLSSSKERNAWLCWAMAYSMRCLFLFPINFVRCKSFIPEI